MSVGAKPPLLVVDDEEVVRKLVSRVLSELFEVYAAGSVDDALQTVALYPGIQVVLTDIEMPGKSGVELHREVVAQNREVAWIAMTGGRSEMRGYFEALRIPVIDKPFSLNQIRDAALAALAGLSQKALAQRERGC